MKNLIVRTADGTFKAEPQEMVDTLQGDPSMVQTIITIVHAFKAALVAAQMAKKQLPLDVNIHDGGEEVSIAQPGGAHTRFAVDGLAGPLLAALGKAGFDPTPPLATRVSVGLDGIIDVLQH